MTRRRVLRATSIAVLALTPILLAACGGSSGSGTPSTTTEPVPRPESAGLTVADLARLTPKHRAEVLPVLLATSGAAVDDLLARSGIAERFSGAAGALDALGAAVAEDVPAATPVASPTPVGFRRSPVTHGVAERTGAPPAPLAARGAALGLATLGTAITGGLETGADGRSISGDQTVNFGDPVEGTPAAQLKLVDGTLELRILQRASTPVDGGEMSVDLDLQGVLDACPSADGTVTAALSADVRIEAVSGASTVGGRYTLELDVSASVDDTAELTETVVDATGSISDTTTTTSADAGADIDGWFVEGGSRTTVAGRVADGLTLTGVENARITRSSATADEADAGKFVVQQATIATALATMVLAGAEEFWRGGACVDVQLVPAGDPTAVRPGDDVPIAVEATSAVDGQPIGAPATAVATATGGTATPSDATQELPADVVYTVPDDGSDGEVAAQVTSRRGIGTSTLPITVARALVVDGQLDVFHASGTKCGGLSGAWELALAADFQGYPFRGTLRFDLSADTGAGEYTLVGSTSAGGVTVDQSGTGTVEAVAGPDGQQLIFTGSAWTGGPSGVRSIDAIVASDADC